MWDIHTKSWKQAQYLCGIQDEGLSTFSRSKHDIHNLLINHGCSTTRVNVLNLCVQSLLTAKSVYTYNNQMDIPTDFMLKFKTTSFKS